MREKSFGKELLAEVLVETCLAEAIFEQNVA